MTDKKRYARLLRNKNKRETLVGEYGVAVQDRRNLGRQLAARKAGRSVDIAKAAEAVRRVGEYKKRRVDSKTPGYRDYKPPIHGKRKK